MKLVSNVVGEPLSDFGRLTARLRSMRARKRVAVVCPGDPHTEYAIRRALDEGWADFLLLADEAHRPDSESLIHSYPDRLTVVKAACADDAAARAVTLVRQGEADVLMKGLINTDNLLRAVLRKDDGLLPPGGVLSHIGVACVPGFPRLLFFSDAAVIPAPTLDQWDALLRADLQICRRLGVEVPRVALIHCTEKTSERFPCTLHYRTLKERAASGCYGPLLIDGPMDVKTACDAHSGAVKGICSSVTGTADLLLFPEIESGNAFYKTLSLFAHAEMAGMLTGTTAPVVVPSRADSGLAKYHSLALACLASSPSECL